MTPQELESVIAKLEAHAVNGVVAMPASGLGELVGRDRATWLRTVRPALLSAELITVESSKGRAPSRIVLNRRAASPRATVGATVGATVPEVRTTRLPNRETYYYDNPTTASAATVGATVQRDGWEAVVVVGQEIRDALRALVALLERDVKPENVPPTLPPGVAPEQFERALAEKVRQAQASETSRGRKVRSPRGLARKCRLELLATPGEVPALLADVRKREEEKAQAEKAKIAAEETRKRKAEADEAQRQKLAEEAKARSGGRAPRFKVHGRAVGS